MSSSGTPVTFLAMKEIIPYLDANTIIQSTSEIPLLQRFFPRVPLTINTLSIAPGEVQIDNSIYKFTRLMSWFPREETDCIQISVNGALKQLLKTRAPVEKVMNVFLEKVFNKARPVKIGTLLLRTLVTADIELMVEHVVIGAEEARNSKILSKKCLPLKSMESLDWAFGFPKVDCEKLIFPDTRFDQFVNLPYPRAHVRALTPGPGFVPPFLMHLLDAWVVYRSLRSNHWSFEIPSTGIYCHFMVAISFLEALDMEIVNEEYHVTTPNVPGETLKVVCQYENGLHILHLKFEKAY